MSGLGEALVAGAGTGKTHALVTRVLARLEGTDKVSPGPPRAPGEVLVVTFTNKAAAELKERIRARARGLASGAADPALDAHASGARFAPEQWAREVLPRLGDMHVGTFHAFGQWVLRTHAAEAGVEPDFDLLSPEDAKELLERSVEAAVLARLDDGDAAVSRLIARLKADRLVSAVAEVRARLANEGEELELTALRTPIEGIDVEGLALADLARAREKLVEAGEALASLPPSALKGATSAAQKLESLRAVWSDVRPVLGAAGAGTPSPASWTSPDALLALARLDRVRPSAQAAAVKASAEKMRDGLEAIPRALSALEIGPLYPALGKLLAAVERTYGAAKSERRALDQDDLLVRARNVLRDRPEAVRRPVKARFSAVLVDEFQDTNWVQLELVALVSERRDRLAEIAPGARALPTPLGPVELEPGLTVIVGDPKQAIYEFRGADVGVFNAAVRLAGPSPTRLVESRRSVPGILDFANALSAHVFASPDPDAPDADFRVRYAPELDDLRPVRARPPGTAPAVEWLESGAPEGARAQVIAEHGAKSIAARIAALLDKDHAPGDACVLARRADALLPVQRALDALGIGAVIAGGSGFYQSQEVADVVALARLVSDPTDAEALLAVLRSPIVALSDATILRLAYASGPYPALDRTALSEVLPEGVPPDQLERLARFRRVIRAAAEEVERAPLAAVVRRALGDLELALAGDRRGEARLANVERALAMLADEDRKKTRSGGPRAVVRRFARAVAEGDRQPPALVEPAEGAVRLMTVHAAKGLEFPIVALADLHARPRGDRASLRYHRSVGIVMADDVRFGRPVIDVLNERAAEESKRLLYVAITRARDRLLLSGLESPGAESWASKILSMLAARPELEALIARIPPPPARPGKRRAIHAVGEGPGALAARAEALAAPRPEPPLVPELVAAPDLAVLMECPRRWKLSRGLGLAVSPGARAPDLGARLVAALDGIASDGPLFARAAIDRLLEGLAIPAGDLGARAALERFARSKQGKALLAARPDTDLEYALALDGHTAVRGRVDVLVAGADGAAVAWMAGARGGPDSALEQSRRLAALALRGLLPSAASAKAHAIALDDSGVGAKPPSPEPDALPDIAARAAAAARHLTVLRAAPPAEWPGLTRARCEALGCPFVEGCHAPI